MSKLGAEACFLNNWRRNAPTSPACIPCDPVSSLEPVQYSTLNVKRRTLFRPTLPAVIEARGDNGGRPLPRIAIKSTILPAAPLPAPSDSSLCRANSHFQEEKRCVLLQRAARVLCLIAVLMLSACQPRAAPPTPMEPTACGGRFEATVRQGPSAGLALVGQLEVRVEPSGQARAVLNLRDGPTLRVSMGRPAVRAPSAPTA